MKNIKKIITLFLMISISLSTFVFMAGCRNDKVDLHEGELYIASFGKGLGRAWLDEMMSEYKKIYPNVTVQLNYDLGGFGGKYVDEIKQGPAKSGLDLIFLSGANYRAESDLLTGKKFGDYTSIYADISDIYEEYPVDINGAEGKTIRQKIAVSALNALTYKGKQYSLPYSAGSLGLVCNVSRLDELLGKGNYSLPQSTEDLISLIGRIKTAAGTPASVYPIIWAGQNASVYWDYLVDAWHLQYEGYEKFYQYWEVNNGTAYSSDTLRQDGRLKALQALEQIIGDRTNSYPNCESVDNITAQFKLLNGEAIFMPTGYWIESEMLGTIEKIPEYKMLSTPYLSAAAVKWAGNEAWETLKNAQLSDNMCAYIPCFSAEINEAKNFLKFVASDTGIKIMMKHTAASFPLRSYTDIVADSAFISGLTPFQKEILNLNSISTAVILDKSVSKLRYLGQMPLRAQLGEDYELSMYKSNNKQSATNIYNSEIEYFTNTLRFNGWKTAAGV